SDAGRQDPAVNKVRPACGPEPHTQEKGTGQMKDYKAIFDLQLFAEDGASGTDSKLLNTTGTMTNEMKVFYEKRLIDQAEPRLVHDQFADYYPMPVGGGKTIEFRK